MNKFYNDAIIGNKNIVVSYSETGELQRFCFPEIDGRQFVDFFRCGVKVNDSNIIYLHEDINNKYNQRYVDDTNILVTDVENTYFNLKVKQIDCVLLDKNILIKKYVIENANSIDLDVKFIVDSKILSSNLERFGSKINDNGVIQYNHNYALSIFSDYELYGHKLNDVQSVINSAVLYDKDYIGMSDEVAISYNIGIIHPNEKKEFFIGVYVDINNHIEENLNRFFHLNIDSEIENVEKYWKNYVESHKRIKLNNDGSDFYSKLYQIYNRTILLFPLLTNYNTGGIAAALEVDENRVNSGSYCYCWPRDAIFITRALDLLNMEKEADLFYSNFCKNTQSENGMWEQRFFTDGTLAPCWGYQIDETASVVYGVYDHYKNTKNLKFLENNLIMCEKAVKFLMNYVKHILSIEEEDLVKSAIEEKYKKRFQIYKQPSYDLWEMNEGIHLYSISAIIASFEAMKNIYNEIDIKEDFSRLKREKRNNLIIKLNKYIVLLKEYVKTNFIDYNVKTLKRNLNDNSMDISIVGAVCPFDLFDPHEKVVRNTIDRINMTLRTYTSGYLRFENDGYMGGNNPWVITTLWMALYYIKAGDVKQAEDCFKYVVNTACKYGFLAEQVNNEDDKFKWVIGLGWSHAMFIIVLEELIAIKSKKHNLLT